MIAAATIRRLNVGPEIRKIVGVSVEDTVHPLALHGSTLPENRESRSRRMSHKINMPRPAFRDDLVLPHPSPELTKWSADLVLDFCKVNFPPDLFESMPKELFGTDGIRGVPGTPP